MSNFDYLMKILMIGDSNAQKGSLLSRFSVKFKILL